MLINERHERIINELAREPKITVRELSQKLYVSEPTVRRDLTELHRKGIITKHYGGAVLNRGAADREIPFVLRENEKSVKKAQIGKKAMEYIRDGAVIMLDASSSAYHLVPYISEFKDIIVITSGAKTALALAEAQITVYSTGGRMRTNSYSYIGREAEDTVRRFNADVLFFSCHGVSDDGMMSDPSVEEANLRRVMFECSREKYLLCDSSKFGKTYFYNMGNVGEINGMISDSDIPANIEKRIGKMLK